MKKTMNILLALMIFSMSTVFAKEINKEEAIKGAEKTEGEFKDKNATLRRDFDYAYGYVIFETIGKGAHIIGFAGGKGVVYEQGEQVGFANMKQVTFGATIGGQAYSQVIFFEDEAAMNSFKENKLEVSAQVSAVAATAGTGITAPYKNGIKIYTNIKGGLMAEASAGGQKIKYESN